MWRRSDLSVALGTLLVSTLYLPLVAVGFAMVASARRAFNPGSKDSVYSPSFQRATAWFLLALALIEGVTGFGAGPQTSTFVSEITLGLLNRGNSLNLHIVLIGPLTFFFILHSTSGVGSMLLRRGVKSWYVYEVMIPAVMLGLYGVALYLYSLLI